MTAVLSPWEYAAQQFEAPTEREERWPTPGALAQHLDHRVKQTPALDLVDEFLKRAETEPDFRGIITIAPQEGKSHRVGIVFPVWWLERHPDARIVGASYAQGLANRNGKAVRRVIETHPELNMSIADDNGAAADWTLKGQDGGLISVGVGGGLTGRPADVLIIDDPIKDRKEADSEVFRQNVWDWWTDVAAARLAPGAPVIVILTRWHEDDLAGRLLKEPDSEWELLNIPAQANHNPDEGETDILGREPGEFLESARGRTKEGWERRKRAAGSRTWNALYQGNPTTPEGGTFKRHWWKYYDQPQWMELESGAMRAFNFDEIMLSWDMAFKDKEDSDYVVGAVWGRRGADAYLLDLVRGQWDFPETLKRFKAQAAKWPQATLKLVEDKANGTAVIATLKRSIPGIVPEEPRGSKPARAAAVAPLVEAGNVYLPDPEILPMVEDFVEEHAAFPTGVNDDYVDTTSQALGRLVIDQFMDEGVATSFDELDAEMALHGSYVP